MTSVCGFGEPPPQRSFAFGVPSFRQMPSQNAPGFWIAQRPSAPLQVQSAHAQASFAQPQSFDVGLHAHGAVQPANPIIPAETTPAASRFLTILFIVSCPSLFSVS